MGFCDGVWVKRFIVVGGDANNGQKTLRTFLTSLSEVFNIIQPANMKSGITLLLLFLFTRSFAQEDTSLYIKVNFLYGSKPLRAYKQEYCDNTPYDYAFFGMRCASATREILGEIGVMKKRSRFFNIATAFYPKRLRRKLFRLAKANNFEMITTEGRPTRKWERD